MLAVSAAISGGVTDCQRDRALHDAGESHVGVGPGRFHRRREVGPEALLEGPKQRRADRLVVLRLHSVAGMAAAETFDRGDDLVDLVQIADRRGQHGDQLHLLLPEIVGKHPPHIGGDLEQAVVEQIGGDAGYRHDLLEALLHHGNPLGRHCGVPPEVCCPWWTAIQRMRGPHNREARCNTLAREGK